MSRDRREIQSFTLTLDVINEWHYYAVVIRSFADRKTEEIWRTGKTRGSPPEVVKRKLALLDAAIDLSDLRDPPGNRLEKLKGDRLGQYSIRINNQYRICFVWHDHDAYDVEITDYH